jgi:pimeloyl-ACP methyl ester carboxylesterase
MRWNLAYLLVTFGLCAACGKEDPTVQPAGPGEVALPQLVWAVCDTSVWPDGYPKPASGVQCAMVPVPLDWSQPDGEKMSLRIARHESKAFPTGKAIFQLAGGPGGGSVFQSGLIPMYFSALRDTFDVVYVDQRGTGGSGYLDCSRGYPGAQAEWEACADEHAGEPLQHYLTLDAARDLDFVRRVLGYDKIYVRGGSYGTRLGLEYMRQFGDNLVAVVLDGLAPPDWDFAASVITATDVSLQWLLDDCAADAACTSVSPQLPQDLATYRASVRAHPRAISVGGQPYSEGESFFLSALGGALAYGDIRYDVPRAIHDAVGGDTDLWNSLLSYLFGVTVRDAAGKVLPPDGMRSLPAKRLDLARRLARRDWLGIDYVAPGTYATVSCAEWIPNTTLAAAEALHGLQTWDDGAFLDFVAACSAWPVSPIPAELRAPVTSTVKTLLLSGGIDITTPAAQGEHVLATLPNATHLVVPNTTHSTMGVPCVSGIITAYFRADGDMAQVDTACLTEIGHPSW